MSARTSLLKAALAAGITACSAVAAAADELVVNVYEQGYLPNKLYVGDAATIRFENKTGRTIGLDYPSGSQWVILVNDIAPGASHTLSINSLSGRKLVQPYVFGRGYIGSGRFETKAGSPPLQ